MSRRTAANTPTGIIFAVPWTEWAVRCHGPSCDQQATLLTIGMADTLPEAERVIESGEADLEGWDRIRSYWYCPTCAEKQR